MSDANLPALSTPQTILGFPGPDPTSNGSPHKPNFSFCPPGSTMLGTIALTHSLPFRRGDNSGAAATASSFHTSNTPQLGGRWGLSHTTLLIPDYCIKTQCFACQASRLSWPAPLSASHCLRPFPFSCGTGEFCLTTFLSQDCHLQNPRRQQI